MKKSIKQRAIDFAGDRSQGAGHGYPSWEANLIQKGYTQGAEDQAKTMYSEEEVKLMFNRYNEFIAHHDLEEWQPWVNKQFKKK